MGLIKCMGIRQEKGRCSMKEDEILALKQVCGLLRAMAFNYKSGHQWDNLDSEAVTKAADGIFSLIAECEANNKTLKLFERAEFTYMNALELPDNSERSAIVAGIQALKYALKSANNRIADLEDRTDTVKLPAISFFDFKQDYGFASGAYVNVESMNKALAGYGITLVVGE